MAGPTEGSPSASNAGSPGWRRSNVREVTLFRAIYIASPRAPGLAEPGENVPSPRAALAMSAHRSTKANARGTRDGRASAWCRSSSGCEEPAFEQA
jgi:hypothetical protein